MRVRFVSTQIIFGCGHVRRLLSGYDGGCAFYDELRARGLEHNDALRRIANRLVGILHGCPKTRTLYDEVVEDGGFLLRVTVHQLDPATSLKAIIDGVTAAMQCDEPSA